jgi:hypothetical protein
MERDLFTVGWLAALDATTIVSEIYNCFQVSTDHCWSKQVAQMTLV